ncbi:hypothetical protein GCM10010172_12330 [Paractinoplanes ferrugineus]|uniref:Uncharacterized protein n=1 Tax=Paractinoplanes ferrugineus TaxID=113564 RepID=A0A919MBK1_9ACTN|nr:SitI3 family protein [Actinoplanes ferrugineus]GIE09798.1 hypothetical protein Afe05nite_16380 [Actinoplanes ferrugineus]
MATEYDLYLAGNTPVELVAEWAFPDLADRPTGTLPYLAADHYDKYGYSVVVTAGQNAYIDVAADGAAWEWEPQAFVLVGFSLGNDADRPWAIDNMLAAVRRILAADDQDAALVLNGDVLILARMGGVLVKHRRETWWTSSPAANQLIPG